MATQFETELKIANFRKQVYFIVAIVTTITAIATIVTIEWEGIQSVGLDVEDAEYWQVIINSQCFSGIIS